MKVLLLSNNAPNYYNFFNALSNKLIEDGIPVVVAVESKFAREENKLDRVEFSAVHEFSTYFSSHETDRRILEKYSSYNLNAALLSDFERAQTYDIWGSQVDTSYYDRLKSALLSFFENIVDSHRITHLVYENISNTFAHFAFFVTQEKGAKYLGLGASRLPGRFVVSSDPLNDQEIERTFHEIRKGQLVVGDEIGLWADDYLSRIESITPDYMKTNGLDNLGIFKRYFRKDRISKVRSLLRHVTDSRTNSFQIGNPLRTHINLFTRNLRRRLRAKKIRSYYDRPMTGEEFLLYPLHFHPEASTSILAGAYLDEYEVIRNIAFNLPEGVRLYVKDHVSAWAFPSVNFYKSLKSLPNVRLLAPEEDTKSLIQRSSAVITLTSTVGYEALLMRKRVFLYGRVFYEFHKGVSVVKSPLELHDLLGEKLSKPIDWDQKYNHDFICAYFLTTYSASLNLLLEGREAVELAEEIHSVLVASNVFGSAPVA